MSGEFKLPSSEKDAIAFFQERGILPRERLCENGHRMTLCIGKVTKWRCYVRNCKKNKGLRWGTWFDGTKVSFLTALRFMYGWSQERTSIRWCKTELKMGNTGIVDWNKYLRELCSEYMTVHANNKIGGPDKIVEIDESLFTRRKKTACRVFPSQWILGGICREDNTCFLVQVRNRNLQTLMQNIEGHVNEGSVIFTDCWKSYKTKELEEVGFHQFTVEHSYNFVDPSSIGYTKAIDNMWGLLKWRNKKHMGTARHHLESYLAEFMFRHYVGADNVFDAVLTAIVELCPPKTGSA